MDDDLDLLRTYRAADAVPPRGLQERLEEDLLHAMLDEAAVPVSPTPLRPRTSARWNWLTGIRRPALAFGALAVVALGVATVSNGGLDADGTSGSGSVTQVSANVLDGVASSLFGSKNAATTSAPMGASLDVRTPDADAAVLAGGPNNDTQNIQATLTRDPTRLATLLRAAPSAVGARDDHDRLAFHIAMRWIIDTDVDPTLRAALFRSLGRLDDVDATTSNDVLGRRGVAIGHLDDRSGVREQYLLSENGAVLLEQRSFTTTYLDPACPPGTYTYEALYREDGQQIVASQMPLVIGDCNPG